MPITELAAALAAQCTN